MLTQLMSRIAYRNPVLRGWGNYFKTGSADDQFNQVDHYVHERIMRCLWRREGQRPRHFRHKWPFKRLFERVSINSEPPCVILREPFP